MLKKTRIKIGKLKKNLDKSRNKTTHLGHFEICCHFKMCAGWKVVAFFNFAVISIVCKHFLLRRIDVRGKINGVKKNLVSFKKS